MHSIGSQTPTECIDKCQKHVSNGKVPNGVTVDHLSPGTHCQCNYDMTTTDGSGTYKSCFIPYVTYYLNGTSFSPFNETVDEELYLYVNVSDPRRFFVAEPRTITPHPDNVSSSWSWGEQKYNESFGPVITGFINTHIYRFPGKFSIKADITYDRIQNTVVKDVIVCPHPERSLLRYDDSQNIVKSGENSYIFSMHVFASNCSAFGFEIPILGATKIYATLYDGSSYAISNIEMSTGLLYGMHPVIMDVTNYTLQGALNYTLQLTSESQCGNISESVTLQFEEKIKDLSLQYDGFACARRDMNISWMVRSGYPVQLRYRFNLINGTSVWYTAPDLVFNRTGYLVIPPTIHNSTLGNQSILVEAANRLSFIQYKDIGILMYEPVQEISFNYTELSLFQKAKYGFVFQQNIQINFSIITFPGEGILEYTWIFGDGPNITTIIPNTTYTYQTFGEYNLTVIAETCNKLSTTVSIAVHPPIDNVQYNFNESFTGFYNDTLEFNVTANQWGVDGCVYVDCGDGSPVISYCTSQMVNTAGFSVEGKLNATNGLALNFTHVYREPGLFEMIIIANNTVSTERFNRTFNVTAGPCQPPNITMIGGGMTNLTAPVINRSGSNATIMTEIEIDCLKSQAYRFEWTIFEAENNQRKIINLDIPTDGTSITIPPYSLPFGLICVQLNVSMTHPLFAHIHTVEEVFFNVNVTNVTVKIVNGEDGLERYYREGDSGCYGDGIGKLYAKGDTVTFNTSYLIENGTYYFMLIVEKITNIGNYRSFAVHKLHVEYHDTPDLDFACKENCQEKVVSQERLVLKGNCLTSCKGTKFEWSVYEQGQLMPNIEDIITTPVNFSMFVLMPNVFKEHLNYTVVYTAQRESGALQISPYNIIVDELPKGGSCSVSPAEGEAVRTKFTVSCSKWEDADLPLSYEFSYSADGNSSNSVCISKSPTCTTVLGPGKEENDFKVYLKTKIFDRFKGYTEFVVTAKVNEVELSAEDVKDLGSKPTADVVQTGLAAASSNPDKNTRNMIVDAVASKPPGNVDELKLVSGCLLASMGSDPGALDTNSADKISSAMDSMTKMLSSNASSNMGFSAIQDQAGTLGKMGGSAMQSSLAVVNQSKPDEVEAANKRLALAQKNVEDIGGSVLNRLIPGEKALPMQLGDKMGMLLEKTDGSGEKDGVQSVGNAGVNFPDLGGAASKSLVVTEFNPMGLHNTTEKPDSAVMSINVQTEKGKKTHKLKDYATFEFKKDASDLPDLEKFTLRPQSVEILQSYHSIKILTNQSLHIEIIPTNHCVNFSVYLKKEDKPTVKDHDMNWTLPLPCSNNASSNFCLFYETRAQELNSLPNMTDQKKLIQLHKDMKNLSWPCSDPYTIFLSNLNLTIGKYWIGIFYNTPYLVDIREYNLAIDRIENDNTTSNYTLFDNGTVTYNMRMVLTACVFWEDNINEWSAEGCRVSPKTSLTKAVCECNHFSSFASKVFVAPNPIDLSAVLAGFSNIADNLSVLMMLCGLVGFYIILIILCRRADKRDRRKHGLTVVGPTSSYGFKYLIITFTGARANAGTSANVWIILKGSKEESEPRLLMNPNHPLHCRGDVNAFQVSFDRPLGELHSLMIGHDNSGDNASWYLSQVYIFDLNRDVTYQFCCDRWLAVEEDDGLIERTINVATSQEKGSFTRLFTTKIGRGFMEKHLWLSVYTKPIYSQFSRVQRITCCMALLMFSMLTSAMFFSFGGGPNPYVLKIGSLEFNYRGVIVGIQSAVISILPTTIVLYIFQNARDRKRAGSSFFAPEDNVDDYGKPVKKKKPLGLHHRWRALAWFLAFGMCSSSFIVCLFYSMMWGDAKSKQWVAAVMTGLFSSVIVSQPINIIAVSCLLAIILKDNETEDRVILEEYTQVKLDIQYASDVTEKSRQLPKAEEARKPPSKEELQRARHRRILEIRTNAYFKEMLTYFLFVAMLSLVANNYREPNEYRISRALEHVTKGEYFNEIHSAAALWNWLHDVCIPRLFRDSDVPTKNPAFFLPDVPVLLLGQSRIRQVRMKGGSCEIPDLMKPFSKDCIDFYSLLSEEDRKWSVGWTNFTKKARKKRNLDQQLSAFNDNSDSKIVHEREKRALRLVLRSRKEFLDKNKIPVDDDASGILLDIQSLYPNTTIFSDEKWWQFFGALDIDGFPFFGHFSVYGGGGYTAPFKDDVLSSFKVSASLANYHWIDRYSRGVFIEFSVYSPDTNIFATSFMLFEIHPLGALLTQSGVKTFSIYRTHGKNSNAILAGEVIVLLYLFYIIYREIREMISKKWKYFKSVFNWVDVCIIFFTFAGGVLWVARWYQEDKVLLAYKENRDKYHSFPYAATANELFIYIVGLIVYLVTMRMMRVINIFPVVVMFLGVLKSSRGKLLAFLLPFMVLFLAFVQLAYLIFNTNPYFSSFIRTFVSLFLANLGAPLYYEMKDASAIAGPLFYVGFSLFTVMVFLNLLISIINDAIADETGNFAASANDLEFVEFIFSKINSLIRIEIVDVAELAAIREENERKAARQERRNEKRRKEKEERLQRLQEGQEAYLDLDKKLKHAEKTLLSTAAFIEQKTAKIQEKTTKMENEISQQQLSKA